MLAARWSSFHPRANAMALACFAVGLCQTIRVNVIGEAVLAELLLPVLGIAALLRPESRRVFGNAAFKWLLGAMLITLGGYILSDVVQDTPAAQYLRGWGRMGLVITAFVSLAALAALRRQHVWWFCAGMAIGRVLYLRFALGTPIGMWKFSFDGFGYGDPVTIGAAVAVAFLVPRVAGALFVVLGLLSVHWDFRIQSLVCLALAGFLWARAARPERPLTTGGGRMKLALLLVAALVTILAGLELTEDNHSADRRGVSDIGRSVGKRFALKAIVESPLVGYGSWSRGRAFERMHAEALREVAGRDAARFRVGDSSSATHSMILQAWVEGGVLAVAFFVVLGVLLLNGVYTLTLRRPLDGLSTLLLYFGIYGLWHIVMSAFAAPLRIHLALAAVVVVMLSQERHARGPAARAMGGAGRRAAMPLTVPPTAPAGALDSRRGGY